MEQDQSSSDGSPKQVSGEKAGGFAACRHHLCTVTPFSKLVAAIVFIALPFLGAYVGYVYAPEKVVEVEKIIEVEKVLKNQELPNPEVDEASNISDSSSPIYVLRTSYGKEFIDNTGLWSSGSYEVVKVMNFNNLMYVPYDSVQSTTESNLFYVSATKADKNYLIQIDSNNESIEELIEVHSEKTDIPASLTMAPNGKGITLLFSPCTNCAPPTIDAAIYMIAEDAYVPTGVFSVFEWLDEGFRYKPVPEGCDKAYNQPYENMVIQGCEQKVSQLSWVTYP